MEGNLARKEPGSSVRRRRERPQVPAAPLEAPLREVKLDTRPARPGLSLFMQGLVYRGR